MTYAKLLIPTDVVTLIRGLHPDLKKGVRTALETILTNPTIGKSLKDELAGLSSYRVKRFRIIYRCGTGNQIEIIAIGPRKNIYEETFKIMSKKKKGR
jgi:mRNA-degrading endonuclease RelE of RelBE toxin-antitoxin system